MLIELSYPLSEDSPVYPGSPAERFRAINRISNGDDCNTTVIEHYIHAGTHVDAPFHFSATGKTIDLLPIEDFCYERVALVDCPLEKSGLVSRNQIKNCPDAENAEILFLDTGYASRRGKKKEYCDDFPALSEEAALFIRTELLNVKAVAIDSLSIESAVLGAVNGFSVHRTLLDPGVSEARPVIIFEDVNIELLRGKNVLRVYAFPLRLKGVDGSPVNIVAEVQV